MIGLFSFVTRMRFTNACLSATFFTAGMLLLSKDTHLGSRLSGAAIVMGALCFGALVASAVVSSLMLCQDEKQLIPFRDAQKCNIT